MFRFLKFRKSVKFDRELLTARLLHPDWKCAGFAPICPSVPVPPVLGPPALLWGKQKQMFSLLLNQPSRALLTQRCYCKEICPSVPVPQVLGPPTYLFHFVVSQKLTHFVLMFYSNSQKHYLHKHHIGNLSLSLRLSHLCAYLTFVTDATDGVRVNFYRFNAKNWHFRQILRKKGRFFFYRFNTKNWRFLV